MSDSKPESLITPFWIIAYVLFAALIVFGNLYKRTFVCLFIYYSLGYVFDANAGTLTKMKCCSTVVMPLADMVIETNNHNKCCDGPEDIAVTIKV